LEGKTLEETPEPIEGDGQEKDLTHQTSVANQMSLSDQQGREIVALARKTLERFVERGEIPKAPETWPGDYLNQKRGIFVTLKGGDNSLRGCIGFPYPVKVLGNAVLEATIAAAASDPRFPEVSELELPCISIEASVLTFPQELDTTNPLELPKKVRIGVDGLMVSADGLSGLLLPQVATELSLSPAEFLSEVCMKAGLLPDTWLRKNTSVQTFQAEVFSEVSPGGNVVRERLLQEG
jgi:uncharacterized protein (TIGR00296 family)